MADKVIQEEYVGEIIAAPIRESSQLIPKMPQKAITAGSLLGWQKKAGTAGGWNTESTILPLQSQSWRRF